MHILFYMLFWRIDIFIGLDIHESMHHITCLSCTYHLYAISDALIHTSDLLSRYRIRHFRCSICAYSYMLWMWLDNYAASVSFLYCCSIYELHNSVKWASVWTNSHHYFVVVGRSAYSILYRCTHTTLRHIFYTFGSWY